MLALVLYKTMVTNCKPVSSADTVHAHTILTIFLRNSVTNCHNVFPYFHCITTTSPLCTTTHSRLVLVVSLLHNWNHCHWKLSELFLQ